MLVSVESTDKFDSSTIAFDCSDEEFRSIEASLYRVLHRTIANENAENGAADKRTEGIRSMARDREEIRSEDTCQTKNQHVALISNISERDRAKDVRCTNSRRRSEMRKKCSQSRNRCQKACLTTSSEERQCLTANSSLRWRTSSSTRLRQSRQPEAGKLHKRSIGYWKGSGSGW